MAPGVDFLLTDESYKDHIALLARQGITVKPISRTTIEELEKGGVSHLETSGVLIYGAHEFIYHIFQRTGSERIQFEVLAYDNGREAGDAIVSAISQVFPPYWTGTSRKDSPPKPKRKLDRDKIITISGCGAVLVFVIVICTLIILGIRSLI